MKDLGKCVFALACVVFLAAGHLGLSAQDEKSGNSRLLGKYVVWQNQAILHDLEMLPDGKYKISDRAGKSKGEGGYRFDAKTKTVVFNTGPYKDSTYTGVFEVEHKIRVTRVAYGINDEEITTDDTEPRLGKYTAGGAFVYFDLLPKGKYKAYELPGGKLQGEGEYTFNEKDRAVKWVTGPYKDKWGYHAFSVEYRIGLNAKEHIRALRVVQ